MLKSCGANHDLEILKTWYVNQNFQSIPCLVCVPAHHGILQFLHGKVFHISEATVLDTLVRHDFVSCITQNVVASCVKKRRLALMELTLDYLKLLSC